MVDYTIPIFLVVFLLWVILAFVVAVAVYAHRISKDARLVQQLLTAYMKKTIAGTVADHELADVVREATKTTTPAGVAR